MKHQALFSWKDKSKNKIKVSSAAVLFGNCKVFNGIPFLTVQRALQMFHVR